LSFQEWFRRGKKKLSPPKNITYLIAVVLGVIGILMQYGIVSFAGLAQYSTAMIVLGFVLLALAALVKGL
jgi:hypothetical protein